MCVEERGSMHSLARGRTVEERQCVCERGGGESTSLAANRLEVLECSRRQYDIGKFGRV